MGFWIKDKKFYWWLISLTIPIALQNLINFGNGLADSIMVGRLGDSALSGVTAANQMQNILTMFSLGISASTVILGSQYWGKNDTKSIKSIVSIGLWLSITVGIVFTLCGLLIPEKVMGLLTIHQDVIGDGTIYLKALSASFIFFTISSTLLSAMKCVETVKIGLFISVVSLCVNVFFNWVFIYGNLGVPAMGIAGAAFATLIGRILELTLILGYVLFFDQKLKYRFSSMFQINFQLAKDFFRYGMPVMAGDILWGLGGAAQTAILGRIETGALAANNIAIVLFQLVTATIYGMAGASGIMIGKTVGAEQYDTVKKYTKNLQVIFVIVGVFTGTVIFLCRNLLPQLYNITPAAKEMAVQFSIVLSVTSIGTSYQMSSLTGIVRAGGDTQFVLKNDLIHVWLIVIPLSMLSAFVFHAPAWVVFACLKCDQILKCAVAFVRTNNYKWIKNLTRKEPPTLPN